MRARRNQAVKCGATPPRDIAPRGEGEARAVPDDDRHHGSALAKLKYAKNTDAILAGNAQGRTIAGFLNCYRRV